MTAYIIAGIASGILFGILDGVINANPLAQRLYLVYKPIARTSVNPLAGIAIDLVYGFVMAGVFLLLYQSLPGGTGLAGVRSGDAVHRGPVARWRWPRCAGDGVAVRLRVGSRWRPAPSGGSAPLSVIR